MKGVIKIMCDTVEKTLTSILPRLGISPNIKGYHYICEAIQIFLDSPRITISFSKELYPEIATRYNVTALSIEHAIRNAIHVGYNHCNSEFADSIFQNTLQSKSDVPTNTLFITTLAQWIKFQ